MLSYPFEKTGTSKLIQDFLREDSKLQEFYTAKVSPENLLVQAKNKLKNYENRENIVRVLKEQNNKPSKQQAFFLKALSQKNSVTVTTGHQLNLATGPLYFIYKILHTVKMCQEMNQMQEEVCFVPIYWMATEDHDFEEINHFNTYQNSFEWKHEKGGYVGELSTDGIGAVLSDFFKELEENQFSEQLKNSLEKAYQQENLAEATSTLVQDLLGETGVLILDANNVELKELMIPFFEKELQNQTANAAVSSTNASLKDYQEQAFAREVNLFYLENNQRERIKYDGNKYILSESLKEFSLKEILNALKRTPEKFSPNVILRPLYQEVILPNVCYIGGAGEIAYWLQLKKMFKAFDVLYPLLMVRNSFLILNKNQWRKAEKFELLPHQLFQPLHEIKQTWVQQQTELFSALEKLKTEVEQQFIQVSKIAEKTDDSFRQMLMAQRQKQMNGYAKMEKRLQKAEEKRMQEQVQRLEEIYEFIFPQGSWQERRINFSYFYQKYGKSFFDEVYNSITPFESKFIIKSFDY